ncbi:MAG: hypothetical protein K9G38_08010 [Bacteroidales bacterium]|nr:hypothetical protein [Bacteroidales bacterium]
MKTTASLFTKITAVAVMLMITSLSLFAKSDKDPVYAEGTTISPAGDYVVTTTDEVYYFQGKVYEVFDVSYEDSFMDMKIAVNSDDDCKSYIAYSDNFTVFYRCDEGGFGVRRILFTNSETREGFDSEKYNEQIVLKNQQRIFKKKAIELIASNLPTMQTAYVWRAEL